MVSGGKRYSMLAPRYSALGLALILFILAGSASAQPLGGTEVYLGELNLLAANSSMNSSSMNSTQNIKEATNSTSIDAALVPAKSLASSSGKEVLDLSRYARDRANKSLAGYTNIMYPITGSRGTTTSTSGGGGGGGGCGCG